MNDLAETPDEEIWRRRTDGRLVRVVDRMFHGHQWWVNLVAVNGRRYNWWTLEQTFKRNYDTYPQ